MCSGASERSFRGNQERRIVSETQFSLFDPPAVPAKLNKSVESEDKPRLGKQQAAVLERLRKGPATNMELLPISARFSARIHELRKAGFVINRANLGDGLFEYSLGKDVDCV